MNSDYIFSIEVQKAMEKHEKDEALVIPIILRPIYWKKAPFGKLQSLPKNGIPVTSPEWHNLDTALYEVAEGIREVVEQLDAKFSAALAAKISQTPLTKEDILNNPCGIDLHGANLSESDLHTFDFTKADLHGADLYKTNLTGANLVEADLTQANLSRATLVGSDLTKAKLGRTDLYGADFTRAILQGADLHGANLVRTNFTGADLTDADFSDATMLQTILAHIDLRGVRGLDQVHESGPSTIGIDTVYRSQANIPKRFLQGAGIPDLFIDYMHSLVVSPIEYYASFISYSSYDQIFVERLYTDLQQKGIRCWFAPEDLKLGDKIMQRIDESIRLFDKLLLIFSHHSVASDWVEHEGEHFITRIPPMYELRREWRERMRSGRPACCAAKATMMVAV